MDDMFNFKKFFIWLGILIAGFVFVTQTYTLDDVLGYAAKNPHKPSSERIAYYVGAIHFQKSQYPEALRAYEQVLTDFPTGQYAPKALFRKGTMHLSLNQWSLARESYERYMKEFPAGEDLESVQKKYEYVKFK